MSLFSTMTHASTYPHSLFRPSLANELQPIIASEKLRSRYGVEIINDTQITSASGKPAPGTRLCTAAQRAGLSTFHLHIQVDLSRTLANQWCRSNQECIGANISAVFYDGSMVHIKLSMSWTRHKDVAHEKIRQLQSRITYSGKIDKTVSRRGTTHHYCSTKSDALPILVH